MGGTDPLTGTSWPESSHHLPEAPLLTAEAVPGNSDNASQEQGQGRQHLVGWGRGTSRRASSHQRRAGWSRWAPSPIQGIAQRDPVTPLGSRCLGVPGCPVCGSGPGARRGQSLPEVRAPGDQGGDGAGAQRPSQGLPSSTDTAGAASPGLLWQASAGLLAAGEAMVHGVSRLGSDWHRAPWGAGEQDLEGWGPEAGVCLVLGRLWLGLLRCRVMLRAFYRPLRSRKLQRNYPMFTMLCQQRSGPARAGPPGPQGPASRARLINRHNRGDN